MNDKQNKITLAKTGRAKVKRPVRVFKFGVLRPTEEVRSILHGEAAKANDIQNKMSIAEEARRDAFDRLLARIHVGYAESLEELRVANEEAEHVYDVMRKARAKSRKRIVGIEEEVIAAADAKQLRRAVWAKAKKQRSLAWKVIAPEVAECKRRYKEFVASAGAITNSAKAAHLIRIEDEMCAEETTSDEFAEFVNIDRTCRDRIRLLRRVSEHAGIGAHTINKTFDAFRDAKKRTDAAGGRLRMKRGSMGRVVLSFTESTAPEIDADGLVSSKKLTISLRDDNRTSKRAKKNRRALVAFSTKEGVVELNIVLSRVMPRGGKVLHAWVAMSRVSGRVEYSLQLTVSHHSLMEREQCDRADKVVVKPSWRSLDDDVRTPSLVACDWLGSDGRSGMVVVDARCHGAFVKAEYLRSVGDMHRNATTRAMRLLVRNGTATAAMDAAMKSSHLWRNPSHLRRIAKMFREAHASVDFKELWKAWRSTCVENAKANAFGSQSPRVEYFQSLPRAARWMRYRGYSDSQQIIAFWLMIWEKKDRHLDDYRSGMERTARRRRLYEFRCEAKYLASEYDVLEIENVGIKRAGRKEDETKPLDGPSRVIRRRKSIAAPGELALALANAFRVPPSYKEKDE